MSPFDFKERVIAKLNDAYRSISDAVLTGSSPHDEYKAATGKLRGIDFARVEIESTYKELYEIRQVGERKAS